MVWMIFVQSFTFSVPGLLLALCITSILNVLVSYIIYLYSYGELQFYISSSPLLLGIGVGLLMPTISNIMPIKKALSRSIRDALDIFHNSINDISVKIVKLESWGLDPVQSVFGFVMVSAGVIIYYIIPSTFLFENF